MKTKIRENYVRSGDDGDWVLIHRGKVLSNDTHIDKKMIDMMPREEPDTVEIYKFYIEVHYAHPLSNLYMPCSPNRHIAKGIKIIDGVEETMRQDEIERIW